MNRETIRLPLGIATVMLLAGTSLSATTQWRGARTCGKGTICMFPVKMVCKTEVFPAIDLEGVDGVHKIFERTFLNVLNVHRDSARFKYKVVWPRSRSHEGRIFEFEAVALPPNGALTLDCADYLRIEPEKLDEHLEGGTPTEGFLVIESPQDLQVVAVYQKRNVKEGKAEKSEKHHYWAAKKNVFGPGEVPREEITPVQRPDVGSGEEVPTGTGGAGRPAAEAEVADAGAKTDTEPDTVRIPVNHFRTRDVHASGLGIGLGVGVGHGVGVGIGTGISVDVEYIEPFVMPAPGR